MIEFILLIVIATVWIWGVKCVFSEGYLLEKAGDWWYESVPEWAYNPTIGCTACMSSVHGTLWYWTFGLVLLRETPIGLTLIIWVLFCICLCGVNFILIESIYKDNGDTT